MADENKSDAQQAVILAQKYWSHYEAKPHTEALHELSLLVAQLVVLNIKNGIHIDKNVIKLPW